MSGQRAAVPNSRHPSAARKTPNRRLVPQNGFETERVNRLGSRFLDVRLALGSNFRNILAEWRGMKVSFLRKQESRFIPPEAEPQAIWSVTFWIPAFAGMTPFTWLRLRLSRPLPPEEMRVASFG